MSTVSFLETKQRQIEVYIHKLDGILDEYQSTSKKSITLSQSKILETEVEHLQSLIRSFEIELTNLKNRKHARIFRKKGREYDKYLRQVKRDVKWISGHARGQESSRNKSGEFTVDKIEKDEDVAIAYGRKLQFESLQMADRAIKDLEETKNVAADTAVMVNEQTEKISKMDQNLAQIESEMERATQTLKRMSRKVMTDKYVWCLLVLIIIAIIAIIVIQFVDIQSLIDKLPDKSDINI